MGRELTLFPHKYFAFCQEERYIEDGNSPEQLNSITNDEQKSFVLAVGGGAAPGMFDGPDIFLYLCRVKEITINPIYSPLKHTTL